MARVAPVEGEQRPPRRDLTQQTVHLLSGPVVAWNRLLGRGCGSRGVRFEGATWTTYVLAACCNGTGHLTQAKVIFDTLRGLGYECVGVILEKGISQKLRDEVIAPMAVPVLVLDGVQLVDRRGAISTLTLALRGARFSAGLAAMGRECRAFVEDAAFCVSCWHYSLALLLSTTARAKTRVLHVAPQFALAPRQFPRSGGLRESAWRGGLLALQDIFRATGSCASVGDALPPLLEPPPPYAGRKADQKRIVLCYFLAAGAADALSAAVAAADVADAEFHVFSDPPTTCANLVAHAKSRAEFRELFERCDAVVCSAGNETVWEAVCRGVPTLAVPTTGHAEQVLNAACHARRFPALVRSSSAPTAADVAWLLAGAAGSDAAAAESRDLRAFVATRRDALRAAVEDLRDSSAH